MRCAWNPSLPKRAWITGSRPTSTRAASSSRRSAWARSFMCCLRPWKQHIELCANTGTGHANPNANDMKVATYNVNSIRQRLPIVLDWITEHKPDVMCLQETKVQDQDFPAEAIRNAGYHASYRGMKGYNGVATLTRTPPEKVMYGLHEGPDNEDFRVIRTVVSGIPIINSYVPQGYSIDSDKFAFKLAWFRR